MELKLQKCHIYKNLYTHSKTHKIVIYVSQVATPKY